MGKGFVGFRQFHASCRQGKITGKTITGGLLALASAFLIYGCTAGVKSYPNTPFKGVVEDGKNYWVNDISSHVYDVPRKDSKGVKGVESGKAMPIPNPRVRSPTCHAMK